MQKIIHDLSKSCYSFFTMNVLGLLRQWDWWATVSIVVGALLLVHFSLNLLYRYTYSRQLKADRRWGALIIKVLYRPVKLFLWFFGCSLLASLYAHNFFDVTLESMISNLLRVGVIFCMAWGIFIIMKEGEKHFLQRRHYDPTTIEMFSKLSMIVIVFFTLLLVLPLFGIHVGGILAFGGFSGIVVGFAAKEAMANVLGGIVIAIDKPFRIGEWIYSQDEKIEGIVEHIGWRMTKIRQFDKRPVYIPNSLFSTLVFINASRMTNWQLLHSFEIRYEDMDKVGVITADIRKYIEDNPLIDQMQYNFCHLDSFGISGAKISCRIYLKTIKSNEYRAPQEKMLLDIYKIVENRGAEMSYPTTMLHFKTLPIDTQKS